MQQFDDLENVRRRKYGYFCGSLLLSSSNCFVVVSLWSSIGCDEVCIDYLIENEYVSYISASICICILGLLYLFDFFYPPHLPEESFTLGDHQCKSICLVSFAITCFLGTCYFSAKTYPAAPLAISLFLLPILLAWMRQMVRPSENSGESFSPEKGLEDRMRALKAIVAFEKDQVLFYGASSLALLVVGCVSAACWIAWASTAQEEHTLDNISKEDEQKRDKLIMLWAAPIIASITYIIFAVILSCRVLFSSTYSRTDDVMNHLLVETSADHERSVHRRITAINARISTSAGSEHMISRMTTQTKETILRQHDVYMKKMTNAFKLIVCAFVVKISIIYVFTVFVASQSELAKLVQIFIVGYFLTMIGFVYFSFRRLYNGMKEWICDMPLFQSALSMMQSDWVRSAVICVLLPIIPFFLVLSALNQCVRRCRGIYQKVPIAKSRPVDTSEPGDCSPKEEHHLKSDPSRISSISSLCTDGPIVTSPAAVTGDAVVTNVVSTGETGRARREMEARMVTHRVHQYLEHMRSWNRMSILSKIYVWSALLTMYTLSTPVLNVFLAWLRWLLQDLSFLLICVATFVSGLLLFLLPPVPGAPVYLFGGVVIVQKYMSIDGDGGFAIGSLICILLCFFLKLTACAMQQKLIGENFGSSNYVRQTCMVHTPFMRAVETILNRRGMSFGKCVILCGGPDWPTSVLAGVLKLSLMQCLIGTFPIILYVAPLSLTGCFIPMTSKGEIYEKLSKLMYVLTMLMTVILWAAIAWVIQTEMDRNYEALHRPMEKYLDLDWLDYRADQIKKARNISWDYVPTLLKLFVVLGAIAVNLAAWAFYQFQSYCIGTFEVTDEITKLKVYDGSDGLIKPGGMVGLLTILVGFVILHSFNGWRRGVTRHKIEEENEKLDVKEAEWKANRLREAHMYGTDNETQEAENAKSFEIRDSIPDDIGGENNPQGKVIGRAMSDYFVNARNGNDGIATVAGAGKRHSAPTIPSSYNVL